MQISQLEVDQWPPPLRRARSGSSRDNKKVSCETLSKVDWYSRRPYEAQLYYQSDDDDDDAIPASEAEDEHKAEEDEDYQEGGGPPGKLESHGYGEGLSAEGGLDFLACFPSKSAHSKPPLAIPSPGRETKKTEWGPRTYASPIPHSGSLLPQSGRFLPHSGPLKLHVGSHANTHNSKISGSTRGSSLMIPSSIWGKSSKASGSDEPSSPKVTCLGRIKIKQRYCREMGRLADMAVVAPNEKAHTSIGDQMMKLRRRMHRAHAVVVVEEATLIDEAQKASPKAADMSGRGKLGSRKKADKHSVGSMADLRKSDHSWGSNAEDALTTDSDSDSKGQRGKWRLKESGARLRLRGDKKKLHSPDYLVDIQHSSLRASDCAIDLNRFRSLNPPQIQDNRSMTSMAGKQKDGTEFVPQVPPPNSLLLMRNSKSRGCISASSCRRQGTDSSDKEDVLALDKQMHLSTLKDAHEGTPSLQEMLKVEKLCMEVHEHLQEEEFGMMADVHEQTASFKETKVKKLGAVVPTKREPLQESLRKMSPEAASLWQRRSVMKPTALHVG